MLGLSDITNLVAHLLPHELIASTNLFQVRPDFHSVPYFDSPTKPVLIITKHLDSLANSAIVQSVRQFFILLLRSLIVRVRVRQLRLPSNYSLEVLNLSIRLIQVAILAFISDR